MRTQFEVTISDLGRRIDEETAECAYVVSNFLGGVFTALGYLSDRLPEGRDCLTGQFAIVTLGPTSTRHWANGK